MKFDLFLFLNCDNFDLLRDRLQIEQLEHDKISKSHQKLNGELTEDNKKLSAQINDFLDKKVNGLRKGGM